MSEWEGLAAAETLLALVSKVGEWSLGCISTTPELIHLPFNAAVAARVAQGALCKLA